MVLIKNALEANTAATPTAAAPTPSPTPPSIFVNPPPPPLEPFESSDLVSRPPSLISVNSSLISSKILALSVAFSSSLSLLAFIVSKKFSNPVFTLSLIFNDACWIFFISNRWRLVFLPSRSISDVARLFSAISSTSFSKPSLLGGVGSSSIFFTYFLAYACAPKNAATIPATATKYVGAIEPKVD